MLRAKESFFAFTDEGEVPVTKGQVLETDHPAVAGREHLFDELDTPKRGRREQPGPVEQATANPGEKRPTRRRATKKAAAKKTATPDKAS